MTFSLRPWFVGLVFIAVPVLAVASSALLPVLVAVAHVALGLGQLVSCLDSADVLLSVGLEMKPEAVFRLQTFPTDSTQVGAVLVLENVFQERTFVAEKLPTHSAAALSCSRTVLCCRVFPCVRFYCRPAGVAVESSMALSQDRKSSSLV